MRPRTTDIFHRNEGKEPPRKRRLFLSVFSGVLHFVFCISWLQEYNFGMSNRVPHIEEDKCIGCTLCTQIAPGTFQMKDNGKAEVCNPTGDTPEMIEQAMASCPVQSIIWKENE